MRTLRILDTAACALLGVALLFATSQAAPRRHTTGAHKAGKAHASVTHRTRVAARAVHAPGSAGMVVAVDPETGGLRMPSSEELQALYSTPADQMNFSSDGLVKVANPRGGFTVDLQGRFQEYSVARIGPDGKPIFGCGQSQAAAMAETFAPHRPTGALEVK
jgi:hypothetical protein